MLCTRIAALRATSSRELRFLASAVGAVTATTAGLFVYSSTSAEGEGGHDGGLAMRPRPLHQPHIPAHAPVAPPTPRIPTYTLDEVQEHDTPESLWVTYRDGVYDLTSFAEV